MFCAAIKLIVVEVSVLCCRQVDSGGGVLCSNCSVAESFPVH